MTWAEIVKNVVVGAIEVDVNRLIAVIERASADQDDAEGWPPRKLEQVFVLRVAACMRC